MTTNTPITSNGPIHEVTSGDFELREQSGSRGYFGRVALQVMPQTNGKFEVTFADQSNDQWQAAARFGIDYFLEHIAKKKFFPTGLQVEITELSGHPVDTSNLVICYVTIQALARALQDKVTLKRLPELNTATGVFEFPK